jgi:cytoplasmic iron level regulating protein YaaA (DUF328/UPF0246 family)
MALKIFISPAKSLDFEREIPNNEFKYPAFLDQSERIMKVLKPKSPKKLKDLMSVSDNIAELNWKRNEAWHRDYDQNESRASIYAFTGDVYQGLEVDTLDKDALAYLDQHLYILSGLYGMLKPLDAILPYRLEMGTKLKVGTKKNLYDLWKPILTKTIEQEISAGDWILNLASNEYSKALDFKKLDIPVVSPAFKDYKDGKLKMISFFAKKARGMMLRYVAEHGITNPEDLKNFKVDGYSYDENLSTLSIPVFTR